MLANPVIQIHRREAFERNVGRAVLAGAAAGSLELALERLASALGWNAPGSPNLMFLASLAVSAAALACVRGDRMDRILLYGFSAILPSTPWLLGLSAHWAVATGASIAGVLMVRSHLSERGEEGQLGEGRPGLPNYLFGAALCAVLALAGTQVARVLVARLSQLAAPALVIALLSGATIALFAALASVAAHLALRPDPVDARCEAVLAELSGEFQALVSRALQLYRQCGRSLALLPRELAREELARTLATATRNTAELAADWSGVEAQLSEGAEQQLASEASDLQKSAQSTHDAIARRQLELAASSLREEAGRVRDLATHRERIVARMKAQVALLERARVALIGLRSGRAQLKAAELAAVSRKLTALSALQSDAAKMADEIASAAMWPQPGAAPPRDAARVQDAAPAPDSSAAPVPLRAQG